MFLFNKFYYLYLLSMFTDAEKIIIHLTPFVLGINLEVIIFNDNEDKTIKNMIFAGDNEYTFKEDKLFVLNINGHYELLYSEEDNTKNEDIFQNYINDYYSNINNNQIPPNETENEKQEGKQENNENNFIYESSSIPSNEKQKNEKEKEEGKININQEKKDNNEDVEIKNKYKVKIKTVNLTSKKPKKSFQLDDNSENNKNISDKTE